MHGFYLNTGLIMYINNVKFAKSAQECVGKIDLSAQPRIQEIDNYTGALSFKLVGFVDKLNRPTLSLTIHGIIHALCQNCLQPMEVSIDNHSEITVFYTEDELDAALFGGHDSEVEDGVLAEEEFDVMQLVEDEVIMLIPYAHRHESCVGLSYADEADSPFKMLKEII